MKLVDSMSLMISEVLLSSNGTSYELWNDLEYVRMDLRSSMKFVQGRTLAEAWLSNIAVFIFSMAYSAVPSE